MSYEIRGPASIAQEERVLKKWPNAYAQIWPSTFGNGFSYVIVTYETGTGAKELSAAMDSFRAAWADAAKRLEEE